MRLRDKISLLIDLLLTLALVLIAGIGFLIKYILPPGREKILKYGDNKDLFFLGWDRHQWGSTHLIVAFVMLGLLLLHILLHWKTLLCLVRKAVPAAWLRRSLWLIVGILCLVFFLFAFFITPEQREASDFLHRNIRSEVVKSKAIGNNRAQKIEKGEIPAATKVDQGERHLHIDEDHSSLNGRMTLAEVAERFGLPIDEVKKRLGLPGDVDSLETIGRLRKAHGFTMQEARERLEKAE